MIVDNLANAANYFGLHPLFEKAFEYIKNLDITGLSEGTTEIDGVHLKASVIKTALKNKSEAVLEIHRKFIDIQIPVEREETFGRTSLSNLKKPIEEYDEQNDFQLFSDTPSAYIKIVPGEFVIFSPEDGHAPLIGEGDTTKIIIKVAVL